MHNPFPLHRYKRSTSHSDEPNIQSVARYWTAVDEDLTTIDEQRAQRILTNRLEIAQFDYSRTAHWTDPESLDISTDIAYLEDGGYGPDQVRGHLLDIYLPHEAWERGGHTLPVFIDVHGGGFNYGYKELNRNFNTHLAAQGFAVFSLNYRLAPQTDLLGQVADIEHALQWIYEHIQDWPISVSNIFLTGDSAGATLAWLALLAERNVHAAQALHIPHTSGIPITGAAFIGGIFDLCSTNSTPNNMRSLLTQTLGAEYFAQCTQETDIVLDPFQAVQNTEIPPLFLFTSSDDFAQMATLQFATALASVGADFELHDMKVPPTTTLGHVFPVCMTWLDESQQVLNNIRAFAYRYCR